MNTNLVEYNNLKFSAFVALSHVFTTFMGYYQENDLYDNNWLINTFTCFSQWKSIYKYGISYKCHMSQNKRMLSSMYKKVNHFLYLIPLY